MDIVRPLRNATLVAAVALGAGFFGASCCGQVPVHQPTETVIPEYLGQARDSVLQVRVTFTVDTAGMDPQMKALAAEMGVTIPEHFDRNGRGTSWVVEDDPLGSYLVTAGHLCPDKYEDDDLGSLKISKSDYWVVRRDGGESYKAEIVSVDHEVDLCLLRTVGRVGHPLAVRDVRPGYGEHVSFIGGPFSRWGGNIAPVFEGLYSGFGHIFKEDTNDFLMLTFASGPGASGSPVFYGDAVIGVIVEGNPETWHMMEAVPASTLLKFLDAAGVYKDDPLLEKAPVIGGHLR